METHGFKGKGCEAATKAMEEALGTPTARVRKPEYWQRDNAVGQPTARRRWAMIRQTFRFNPGGQVFGFYTEAIDLKSIGVIHVVRATDIAFNANTEQWEVTRFGKEEVIFTYLSREECVRWSMANLRPEDEQAVEP